MAFNVTSNPYLDNLADPNKRVGAITPLEPKKATLVTISSKPISIMAPRDNSIAAPDKKKSIFERVGNFFRSDLGNSLSDAGKNMKALDNETKDPFNFNNSYPGMEFSGKKPAENNPSAPVNSGELVVNPITMETLPNQQTPTAEGASTVITGDPVADIKKVENEPGSLGAIKENKDKIVKAYADKLKEDPKVKAAYDEKQKSIDTKYKARKAEIEKEYANNPEKMAKKLKKLEARKSEKTAALDEKINNKAEKIASKVDKNYQELSKEEDKELKKVDQYADYDLKDESGKKLSKEDISNLGKQGKLFDKEGKPVSEEEFEKQGFKKTLTDKAAEADPMRALEEGTKEQKFKAFAMMMSGKTSTFGGASKAPAKDNLYGDLASIVQGFTQIVNQNNAKQKFGTFTKFNT